MKKNILIFKLKNQFEKIKKKQKMIILKNRFIILIIFSLIIISKQQNNTQQCTIKNCQNCIDLNSCSICKPNFELYKNQCYSNECSIYGHCNLCNEYDCIKCENGYKLEYGACDKKEKSKLFIQMLFYTIPTFVIIIIILSYFICKLKKVNNTIPIINDNIIKKKHPKCGNYIIINTEKGNSKIENNSINFSNLQTSSSSSYEKEPEKNIKVGCVLCNKRRTVFISDCGCCLCKEHYKKIKNGENLICPIHNIYLEKNYVLTLDKKSDLKGCAIEHLGQQLCPICKVNTGTQGFNCNCNMKLCLKCFNENVYVFKYNTCPGCGKKN